MFSILLQNWLNHCNNCDGVIDENAVDATTWYLDGDQDGFGVDESAFVSCYQPEGMISTGGDCDDTDPAITTCEDTGSPDDSGSVDSGPDSGPDSEPVDSEPVDSPTDSEPKDSPVDSVSGDSDTSANGEDSTAKTDEKEGCGCNSGAGGAGLALLGVLALARRRRD